MKYYSEITKKNYDTVEALQEAETKIKDQLNQKATDVKADKSTTNTERKDAAETVKLAFTQASQLKKANDAKREELDKKVKELDKQYRAKLDEIQREYDSKVKELDQNKEKDDDAIEEQYMALEKADRAALEKAYDELGEFCKKYGAYHYSVDTAGSELFPLLMGFGRMERAQNIFQNMLDSIFNLL